MKQPELGRKIAELRKARGLTQSELAKQCNLSLRTIQRIETAEVSPRSYTIRLIFTELEYDIFNSFGKFSYRLDRSAYRIRQGLEHAIRYTLDLFNLRTNTMRKISIISLVALFTFMGLTSFSSLAKAQSPEKVRKIIEENNKNLFEWFNSEDIDNFMSLYGEEACILGKGCGTDVIRNHFLGQMGRYKFTEFEMTDLKVSGNLAVETGRWTVEMHSGQKIRGEYLTVWEKSGKKWYMIKDSSETLN